MTGAHLIKSLSKTKKIIAIPSAESELYAAVKSSAEVIGIQSMA